MRLISGLVLAALLVMPGAANVAPPPSLPERSVEPVLAFFENFNAGNAEGIASTYSDGADFVWIENGAIVYADKAAAVAGMKERLAATPGGRLETVDYRVVEIGPGAALVIAPITFYVREGDGGAEKAVLTGIMSLSVAFDDEKAEWRIVTGHTSTAISVQ